MIVWKEASVEVRLVQPLHVRCWHCHQTFYLLAQHSFKKKVRGTPYLSLVAGDAARADRLRELVAEEIEKVTPLAGKGACPHCQFPYPLPKQHYTRRERLRDAMLALGFWLGVAGLVAGLFVGWPAVVWTAAAGVGIGIMLGGLIGMMARLEVPATPVKDSHGALTEAEIWNTANALTILTDRLAPGRVVLPLPLYDLASTATPRDG